MKSFNLPQAQGFVGTALHRHRQVTGRPEFNAAVWGRNLEDLDQTIAFQMNDCTVPWNQDVANGLIAGVGRIHQAIRFQLRQPQPLQVADQFQIAQTGIPTIEPDQVRSKAARRGRAQHGLKVVILVQLVMRLVIDAKVTGPMRAPPPSTTG